MTAPDNDRPADEDGGTFKLKPGGASGPAAPATPPASGGEDNLDRTMKIQRGATPPPSAPTTPPPPASPLGNPTGPAEPPQAAFAETTVMPQQSGSQTGFQPTGQQPPQPQQGLPGGPGPQQYGQPGPPQGQPGGYPPPPPGPQQPGFPQAQAAAPAGEAPEGVKRIGLMALIGGGIALLTSILVLAVLGGFAIFSASLSILFALALGWYGYALPRGQIAAAGLRLTGIILMMIAAGGALLGLLGSFSTIAVFGGIGAISLVQSLLLAGVYGYASFIYIKDDAAKAYIKGAPAVPQGYAQGYPQQQYGQPGPQPGQPGFPPPPPGYQQQGQQPPPPPYGR